MNKDFILERKMKKAVLVLCVFMMSITLKIPVKKVWAQVDNNIIFNSDSLAHYNPSLDESIVRCRDEFGLYYRDFTYRFLDGSMTTFRLYLNFCTETVYTPNGTDVSMPLGNNPTTYYVIKYANDLPADVKNDILTSNSSNYNLIQTNGNPTTSYNCHSFAWYSQNASINDTWINFPTAYYIDYSYESVSNPRIGDIICYYDNDGTQTESDDINLHSGIIVGLSGESSNGICGDANIFIIESKWGMEGLYTHKGDECPYTFNHGGDADYVKYYRPKVNCSYSLSHYSPTETRAFTPNGLSSNIIDKYEMYELNVNYHKNYQINVSSSYSLDVRLYDEHMQLLINSPSTTNNDDYSISINPNLSIGRYFLRVAYQNTSNSGSIVTQILGHTHSYTNSYTWLNYNQHMAYCVCGSSRIDVHAVAAKSLGNGERYATCILCGGPAKAGIVPWNKGIKITNNGSFVLPNGTLVLVDEDINSFLTGDIIFDYNDIETLGNINITPYIFKKDDNYIISKETI